MKGKFDRNKTPIIQLGTKVMIHIATDTRNMFAPHCDKAFVTDIESHHYRLLNLGVPTTRGHSISGTFHLGPAQWTLPTVSKADRTVLATTKLLEKQYKTCHF